MIKYLEIKLTKKIKDLYPENCKTLVKESEEDSLSVQHDGVERT